MALWLSRQRKGDLIELGNAAGLPDADLMKRDVLADKLHEHFVSNATRLGDDDRFKEYYKRSGSPSKKDPSASAASGAAHSGEASVVKKRRKTASETFKDETEQSEGPSSPAPARITSPARPTSATTTRTPSRASGAGLHPSSAASHAAGSTISTFPPSPAVITDAIENQTAIVSEKLHNLMDKTHLASVLLDVRDTLSSVIGVQAMILLLEFGSLQQSLMQYRYAFDIPENNYYLRTPQIAISLPDIFVLLTPDYWRHTMLYLLTAFFIPLAASWFFNLTIRPTARHGSAALKPRWRCDPMTFNIVRALMLWLVFAQHRLYAGLFGTQTLGGVRLAVPAGYVGMQIGSAIGIMASLYDAVQRR